MSLFLTVFLACLLALVVICSLVLILFIIAIFQVKKNNEKKQIELQEDLNNIFNGGVK